MGRNNSFIASVNTTVNTTDATHRAVRAPENFLTRGLEVKIPDMQRQTRVVVSLLRRIVTWS